jgi:hypothetical protein
MAMTIRAVAAQAIHGETVVRSGKPFGVDDMDFE